MSTGKVLTLPAYSRLFVRQLLNPYPDQIKARYPEVRSQK